MGQLLIHKLFFYSQKGAATHGNLKTKTPPCQRGAKYCRCAGGAY